MADPSTAEGFFLKKIENAYPEIRAGFVERVPNIDVVAEKSTVLERLRPTHEERVNSLGFSPKALWTAEQVHGAKVATADSTSGQHVSGADALITNSPHVLLGIYVADCGAVYLVDQKTGALGLAHSGKKGTDLNISAQVIRAMQSQFGTDPKDLVACLSPCIRPPAYETDFAVIIRDQILEAGVLEKNYRDCEICTSSNLNRYYSYRLEKGLTGRMLALLGRLA